MSATYNFTIIETLNSVQIATMDVINAMAQFVAHVRVTLTSRYSK